ncbi:MAG: GMC oxidoreductase [Sedimenticola sp.]
MESNLKKIAVIGSGPSGLSAALELHERGYEVDIIDVGNTKNIKDKEFQEQLFHKLSAGEKPSKNDMNRLRWGSDKNGLLKQIRELLKYLFSGEINPKMVEKKHLGSTFSNDDTETEFQLKKNYLPRSFALGGLSNIWGAACYPLRDEDYSDWPIEKSELIPWYRKASGLLGVSGKLDDIQEVYDWFGDSADQETLGRQFKDPRMNSILNKFSAYKELMRNKGICAGRTRLAVNFSSTDENRCIRCGLCMYGCPAGAIWSSSGDILKLSEAKQVSYRTGCKVLSFEENDDLVTVRIKTVCDGSVIERCYSAIFLAAGALGSFKIAALSLGYTGKSSLVENQMYVVPFKVMEKVKGGDDEPDFAMSELLITTDPSEVSNYPTHTQLYSISEPLLGPAKSIVAFFPEFLRAMLFRYLAKYKIGFVYLNSKDSHRISVSLDSEGDAISIDVEDDGKGKRTLGKLLEKWKKDLPLIGMKPVSFLASATPAGFSCHFGGTLPMKESAGIMETDRKGRLHGTSRIFVVDGSVFPVMPAQNPTLVMMANSMRVASEATF